MTVGRWPGWRGGERPRHTKPLRLCHHALRLRDHAVRRGMNKACQRDRLVSQPCYALAYEDRRTFLQSENGGFLRAGGRSEEGEFRIGERLVLHKPFVGADGREIHIPDCGDGVEADPAVLELVGRTVCQVQRAHVQKPRLLIKPQPGAHDVWGRCLVAAEQLILVALALSFDLLPHQGDHEARFAHRVACDAGAGPPPPFDEPGARQLLQGAVHRRPRRAELAGQSFLARNEGAGKPAPLGNAPGHLVADGAEGNSFAHSALANLSTHALYRRVMASRARCRPPRTMWRPADHRSVTASLPLAKIQPSRIPSPSETPV